MGRGELCPHAAPAPGTGLRKAACGDPAGAPAAGRLGPGGSPEYRGRPKTPHSRSTRFFTCGGRCFGPDTISSVRQTGTHSGERSHTPSLGAETGRDEPSQPGPTQPGPPGPPGRAEDLRAATWTLAEGRDERMDGRGPLPCGALYGDGAGHRGRVSAAPCCPQRWVRTPHPGAQGRLTAGSPSVHCNTHCVSGEGPCQSPPSPGTRYPRPRSVCLPGSSCALHLLGQPLGPGASGSEPRSPGLRSWGPGTNRSPLPALCQAGRPSVRLACCRSLLWSPSPNHAAHEKPSGPAK